MWPVVVGLDSKDHSCGSGLLSVHNSVFQQALDANDIFDQKEEFFVSRQVCKRTASVEGCLINECYNTSVVWNIAYVG